MCICILKEKFLVKFRYIRIDDISYSGPKFVGDMKASRNVKQIWRQSDKMAYKCKYYSVYCSMINLLWSFMSKRVRRFGPSATDLVHVLVSRRTSFDIKLQSKLIILQ